MRNRLLILKAFASLLAFSLVGISFGQDFSKGPVDTQQAIAELVAEVDAARPGQQFDVALKLDLQPHWHVYWKNPGDVGQPPSIKWTLPEGVTVGELEFTYPEKIPTDPYVSYGYEDRVFFLATVTLPGDYPVGQTLSLKAQAKWLVCEEMCIPGKANLQLDIPVTESGETFASPKWLPAIDAARKKVAEVAEGGSLTFEREAGALNVELAWKGFEGLDLSDVYFFVEQEALVDSAKPQNFVTTGAKASVSIPLSEFAEEGVPERVAGLLYKESGFASLKGRKTVAFDSAAGIAAAVGGGERAAENAGAMGVAAGSAVAAEASGGVTSLWQALLYAFLGGMILNLMPCVFPVLSIKILGFAQQSGEDHSKVLKHGLVFGAGVLISFWVLAGLLIGLRAAGEGLGWGFQMQNPYFVGVMLLVMFVFGLSLAGLFEFGTSAIGLAGKVKNDGYGGSFSSGVLATAVATPCTGPLMSGALAYALTLPAWAAMTVFTFLALGMATPYMVLSANPKLIDKLPRPGAWMETFKQAMSFLMFASCVWLISVLLGQLEASDIVPIMGGLVFVSVAAWVYGRWSTPVKKAGTRWTARGVAAVLGMVGVLWLMPSQERIDRLRQAEVSALEARDANLTEIPQGKLDSHGIEWVDYSPGLVALLKEKDVPFYIDFTATWCLTCQTNKRLALASDDVVKRIEEMGIVMVKADWTRENPVITRALESFGRSGVPLNVVYDGAGGDPIILPELLKPSIVLEALDQIEARISRGGLAAAAP